MGRTRAEEFCAGLLGVAIEPTFSDLGRYRLEPGDVVAMARRCHANALRVGMKSHQGHAYYQSAVAPLAPGLGARDLLREFLDAGREAGVAVIAYADSKWDTQRFLEHSAWAIRKDGKVRANDARADLRIWPMCPNSPYLEYFKDILREVTAYGPAAVYIDNFGMALGCECRFCANAFREAEGEELPARQDWGDPVWQVYRRWSRERNFALARGLVAAIRSVDPEMVVVFNRGIFRSMTGVGNPEDIREFAHEIADNVHAEAAVHFYGQSFGHINEQCAFGRAIETPMWTWVEYPVLPWSYVSCPQAEVKIKAAKVLANGARPMVWSVPCGPECDKRGMEGVAEVFGLAARCPEFFNEAERLPFLGVVYSSQTMEEYCRGDEAVFDECQKEFEGTLALARRTHIPADVVLDGQVSQERLSRYRALSLPGVAALSEDQRREIRAFVDAGGGLIATFNSSLCDECGDRRDDFGLADVLGARFERELAHRTLHRSCAYSALDAGSPITSEFGQGFLLPEAGRCLGVKETCRAVRLSALLTRCRYYCDYAGERTDYPGMLANEFGKGRAVYIPSQFGRTYAEFGFPDYARLMRAAVEWVTRGQALIRTSLPDTVEVTLNRSATGALVLHLVNCSADLSRPVERVAQAPGGTVQIRLDEPGPRRARALVADAELPCRAEADFLHVELPVVGEYEVVIIE